MIRVCQVVYRFDLGGLENGVVNLANRMDDEFEVSICCLARNGNAASRLKKDTAVYEMLKPEGFSPAYLLRLWSFFRKERFHIVHTRNWAGIEAAIAAKLAGGSRVIHSEHGTDFSNVPKRRLWGRKSGQWAIDQFIAVSPQLVKDLKELVGISKPITLIQNGVDLERFSPGKSNVRVELGIPADAFVALFVGRLETVKNVSGIIRAFRKLIYNEECGQFRLVLAGDGTLREQLISEARALGIEDKVIFAGARNDIPELLRSADCLVLNSYSEGLPNVVLEAMACGLPIIATAVGSLPELLKGERGYLIDVNDSDALSVALRAMCFDVELRSDYAINARDYVSRYYSLGQMVENYQAAYREVMR